MSRAATLLLCLLAVIVAAAGYLSLRGFGLPGTPGLAGVRPVKPGDQEIAWIGPPTSGDTWERLVAAVQRLQEQWPRQHPEGAPLEVGLEHVFTERTTDVPELSLRVGGSGPALWIRWYKTSSEVNDRAWLEQLGQRQPAPVAVLGGENSERALNLARLLASFRGRWAGPDPLFLITTATADRYARENDTSDVTLTAPGAPKLMQVYKDRTFRFSFTNSRMAAVVMAFVKDHPEVWSLSPSSVTVPAGAVGQADGLGILARFVSREELPPVCLYAVAWADDPYSRDLSDRFSEVFRKRLTGLPPEVPAPGNSGSARIISDRVAYGVGDLDRPNPVEAHAIDSFFDSNPLLSGDRELLVLPTATERARRFLRTLANQGPDLMSNLIVLSGDAITFNNVFRDRDTAWNIQDMPVPLIFFSHRDPINVAAGFRPEPGPQDPSAPTGTQDLLLYRDIAEALVQAVTRDRSGLASADQAVKALRQLRWRDGGVHLYGSGIPFFNADGDRSDNTGEHVVWVQPERLNGRVLARATIRVWGHGPAGARWQPAGRPLTVLYDWPARGSTQ
jgi:hypothetical protein